MLAFSQPGIFDARRFPLGLLSLIIGGGMASRLFVEVRERRGLSYGIDAGETVYSDAGLWSVEWQCAPGKLAQILALVRSTLADVAAHGITEDELARAKGHMRGQTALSYEGPGSRMSRLGVNAILGDERTLGELLRASIGDRRTGTHEAEPSSTFSDDAVAGASAGPAHEGYSPV